MSKINNFKYILKSIWSKKIMVILIVIQLSLGLELIINSYSNYKVMNIPRNQVEEELDLNTKDIFFLELNNLDFSVEAGKKFLEFEKELKLKYGNKNIGGHFKLHSPFVEVMENSNILKMRNEEVMGTLRQGSADHLPYVRIDEGIYELLNVEIVKGRGLTNEDFGKINKEVVPILVSERYSSEIRLNDILTQFYNGTKYKVVGFFKQELEWLNEGVAFELKLDKLKSAFLVPFFIDSDDGLAEVAMSKAQSFYINKPKDIPANYLKKTISNIGEQFGLSVNVLNLEEVLANYEKDNMDYFYVVLIQTGFIIFLVIMSFAIIMVYSLKNRRKEIGILMANGMNKIRLSCIILGEIIIIMTIAYIVSLSNILRGIQNSKNFPDSNIIDGLVNFNIKDMIYVYIIIFLLVICISIPTLRKISKMSPSDMMRGAE